MIRIAHISDLHIFKISYGLSQFFSKRWIGNLNSFLSRKKKFSLDSVHSFLHFLEKEKITTLLIAGDFTTTASKEELFHAQKLLKRFQEKNIRIYFVPGNHDMYTRTAYRQKHFYQYFPPLRSNWPYDLATHGITCHVLDDTWFLLCIDSSVATFILSSRGHFTKQLAYYLDDSLSRIPHDKNIMVLHHFPFTDAESPRKSLKGRSILKKILQKHPNVKIYLQGHTHEHAIRDMRKENLPIVIDSGSFSNKYAGSWNLIELRSSSSHIQPFYWNLISNSWEQGSDQTFIF